MKKYLKNYFKYFFLHKKRREYSSFKIYLVFIIKILLNFYEFVFRIFCIIPQIKSAAKLQKKNHIRKRTRVFFYFAIFDLLNALDKM